MENYNKWIAFYSNLSESSRELADYLVANNFIIDLDGKLFRDNKGHEITFAFVELAGVTLKQFEMMFGNEILDIKTKE